MSLKAFQAILNQKGIDACILLKSNAAKPDSNILYFSGLDLSDFCCVVIYKEKEPLVLVPKLEFLKARKVSSIGKVIQLDSFWKQIRHLVAAKTIGLNFSCISINEFKRFKQTFPKTRFFDITIDLDKLRRIKSPEEIKRLRQAGSITDDITNLCISGFKKFRTEADVMDFLEHEARKRGLEVSFPTIVASGKNAAMPHHATSTQKLQQGFCVIDWGIRSQLYCSDMSRTIYLGKPTASERAIYKKVLQAQQQALDAIEAGRKAADIDTISRKILGDLNKYFIHSLGHQIGIDVHEGSFRLSPKSKDIIEKGMVFTIEPGIYIPNKFGIRIEDTVVVDKKAIALTKFTKELIVIN
ncbi:aminopeptidase P family protein [Candidatus Woesearchaeota archaeon]|nr:aminopeptidase P family protein [Candidatus Woesearchaeota archaeon]